MGEVVVPPDNVERRSTTVHQQTHNSAGVAASMPKYDRDSRLPHPGAPVGYKNDQAVTSDHRSPPWDRQQSTWERWPRSHKHHLMAVLHLPGTARHHHLTAVQRLPGIAGLTVELRLPATARHLLLTAVLRLPGIAGLHHLVTVLHLLEIAGHLRLTALLRLTGTAGHLYLTAMLRFPGIA